MKEDKRRRWTAQEKFRIVLMGLHGDIEVSELCRREGINPVQYYGWKKQLMGAAGLIFDPRQNKPDAKEQRLMAELTRSREVIAEITAENLDLKKGALGLEDYGQLPAELQERVHQEVEQTRRRSGWGVRHILSALGVSRSCYYRWRRATEKDAGSGGRGQPARPLYEALAEERSATRRYALAHAGVRHRELAWRMVDEDVAYLSPSTVYRILREDNLVCPWRRRTKRIRAEEERAQFPNQLWATDIKYVLVGERHYYLICFLDEYSRYIVHHELLTSMDANAISTAALTALEKLPRDAQGTLLAKPDIRSDNGSGYVSREFGGVLDEYGLTHRRIRPHCPEENGVMERANRTIGEALDGADLGNYFEAIGSIEKVVRWYNEERLHSALGYLKPVDYHRGNPTRLQEARRLKLATARHRRKERNLGLRQQTMPYQVVGTVT